MEKKNFQVLLFLVPFLFSLFSLRWDSIPMGVISLIMAFCIIGVLPLCRMRQSIWLFVVSAFITTPINLLLIQKMGIWIILLGAFNRFTYYLIVIELLLLLLSIEEIVFGLIGRLIWRNQNKIEFSDGE